MAEPMKVTVVSDYICPWCYIASRRVAQFEREFEVRVEWWPFELHSETPPEGRHVDEVLSRKGLGEVYRQNLREQAAVAGVVVSNRWLANSHRALELAEFGRDRGAFAAVHEALLRRTSCRAGTSARWPCCFRSRRRAGSTPTSSGSSAWLAGTRN